MSLCTAASVKRLPIKRLASARAKSNQYNQKKIRKKKKMYNNQGCFAWVIQFNKNNHGNPKQLK